MRLHIKTPGREFDYSSRDGVSSIVVGNRTYDDICISDDPGVSGPHVRIEHFMGKWSFSDQFSNAGTVHNGAKKSSGELALGDVLTLGATLISVAQLHEEAASPFTVAPSSVAEVAPVAATEFHVTEADLAADFKSDWPGGNAQLKMNVQSTDMPVREEAAPRREAPAPEVAAPDPIQPGSVAEDRVARFIAHQFVVQHGFSIVSDVSAMNRVHEAARKAVRELDHVRSTSVNLPFLAANASGPKHLQLDVHRKHLHMRNPEESQPQQSQAKRKEFEPATQAVTIGGAKPAGAKNSAATVGVILVMVLALGGGLAVAVFDQPPSASEQADELHAEIGRVSKNSEALMAEIDELRKLPNGMSPEEALDRLKELTPTLPQADAMLALKFKTAHTGFETAVYLAMQREQSTSSRDIVYLENDGKLRQALERCNKTLQYAKSSRHREQAVRRLGVESWGQNTIDRLNTANERMLEQLLKKHEAARARNHYSEMRVALADAIAGGILSEAQLRALEAESALYEAAAAQQLAGEIEPALLAAPRPPKLPSFPRNELLPLGGTTSARAHSAVLQRVAGLYRDGTGPTVKATYLGHPAEVRPVKRTATIPVVVMREFPPKVLATVPDAEPIEIMTQGSITQLPPDTVLPVVLAVPDLTLNDLLGILNLCFENGFLDKAGEIALRIRKAEPEKTALLDQLLAAKWSVPVPEGGFPERDGRVVPE